MKKGSYTYIFVALVMIVAFGLFAAAQVYAQQEKQENKVVTFFKNVIKWPFSIAKKGGETVGRTTKRAADMTTKTATSAVETVTGQPEKIKDVLVEPVKGSAETAYIAVEGSVKAPIEGTEEAFKPEESSAQEAQPAEAK